MISSEDGKNQIETHQVKHRCNGSRSRSHQVPHKILGIGVFYRKMWKSLPGEGDALLATILDHPCRTIPEHTGYIFRVNGIVKGVGSPPEGVC